MDNRLAVDNLYAHEKEISGGQNAAIPVDKWKILVVDVDKDVYSITRLALDNYTFEEKPLQIETTCSASEARKILDKQTDFALVLLGEVLESPTAGLQLVDYIRKTLNNSLTRLILRTAYPEEIPDREVIVGYDIDGYISKTEISADKLFSLVVSGLRTFKIMKTNENYRRSLLQKIDQLRTSDERLSQFINSADSSYHIIDKDYVILDINRAALDAIYAANPVINCREQVVGENFIQFYPFLNGELSHFSEVLRTGKRYRNELIVPHPEFGDLVISFAAFKVREGLGIIADNITRRRVAEQALRDREEWFSAITEQSADGITVSDSEGRFIFVNPVFCKMTGYSRKELQKLTFLDIKKNIEETEDIITGNTIADDEGVKREVVLQRKDSTTFISEITFKSLIIADKSLVLGIVTDISKRKEAEQALEKSAEKFRLITENAYDFVWTLNMDMNITYASSSAQRLLGYTPEELMKIKLSELYTAENFQIVRNIVNEELGKGIPHEGIVFKIDHLRKNKSKFPAEVNGKIIYDENGQPVEIQGYTRDLSEQVRAEKEKDIFHQLSLQLTNPATLNEAGKIIASQAQKLFNFDAFSIDFIDEEAEMFIAIYNEDRLANNIKPVATPLINYPLKNVISEDILTGKPKLINRSENLASEHVYVFGSKGRLSRSLMVAPLHYQNKVIGIISVYSHTVQKYNRDSLHLLQIFADHSAGALVRSKIEEALKESEQLLMESQKVAALGSYVLDSTDGLWKNSAVLDDLFGIDNTFNKDIAGWLQIIHPDDRAEMEQYLTGILQANTESFNKEYRIIRVNDQQERWVHGIGVLEYEGDGTAFKMIGTIQDITERKLAEEEQKKLISVLENSKEFVGISTLQGKVLYVNPFGCELVGITESNTNQTMITDYVTGEMAVELEKKILPKIFREGYAAGEGTIVHFKTRQIIDVSFSVFTITMPDKNEADYIGITMRDISIQKKLKQEKEELRAQLYQNQKLESIGTLASGVAHEVNNPLMGIINYAQLIYDSVEDGKLKQFSSGIIEEGERVAKIVKNLLSFAHQGTEQKSSASIKSIIDDSLLLFGSLFRNNYIQTKLDVPEKLPEIKCRAQQIEQVLINLLTNARDALNMRYPEKNKNKILSIRVAPYKKTKKSWIRITVEDQGTGISAEVMDRIFDPFFTTKPRNVGTGLGLSISYGIVKEHNGNLIAESELGNYSRFHIDLPV